MRVVARAGAAFGCVLALAAAARCASADDPAPPGLAVRAGVEPTVARVGERVIYRGRIVVAYGAYQWLPPEPSEDLNWGAPMPRLRHGTSSVQRPDSKKPPLRSGTPDTLTIEIPLQAFRTGRLTIPGLRFQEKNGGPKTSVPSPENPEPARIFRLPAVTLVVVSMLAAADSNADLRAVSGPFGAPWWERLPWRWIAAVALVVAAVVASWILRKRRRPDTLVPLTAGPDAVAVALAELAALRGLHLPAHGRFSEHAFHLTRIARTFYEAIQHAPRPGDTTDELLEHLEASGMEPGDLDRIANLLRVWDRVKFARAASSPEETRAAEDTVETLVRRHARTGPVASSAAPALAPASAAPALASASASATTPPAAPGRVA